MRYFILRTFTDDEAETCLRCNMQELVRCKDCKYVNPALVGMVLIVTVFGMMQTGSVLPGNVRKMHVGEQIDALSEEDKQ